jgi:hypothetical protein
VVGPSGPCSRTDVAKIARNGPCSRTVKGQKPHPRSDQRDTLSYQVPPVKAERASAPEGSAEASERGVPPFTSIGSYVLGHPQADRGARSSREGGSTSLLET